MAKEQKCWTCANACGGCSWTRLNDDGSVAFEPVPGWTAEKKKIWFSGRGGYKIDTYAITACPEYAQEPNLRARLKRVYQTGVKYDRAVVTELSRRGLSIKKMAEELGVAERTAFEWRKKAVGERGT